MKSFRSVMNIGIVLPKLYPTPQGETEKMLSNLISVLKDPFFTAVEVSYIADEKARDLVKKYTEYSGVEVLFNGGDAFRELNINLSSLDSHKRDESIERCKMLVDQCYEMNARIMHIVTGKFEGEQWKEQNISAFIQSAKEICKYAKKKATDYELCISLETGDRHVDRQYLLGPTHEAVHVAQLIRKECRNFGLLLDQSHLPIMEENPVSSLWLAKDYLTHIHLGNSYVKDRDVPHFGDKHIPFGIKDSEVDIPELIQFIRTLHEIDFFKSPKPTKKPIVTFEVGCLEDEPAELVIANVKRTFLTAWEMA